MKQNLRSHRRGTVVQVTIALALILMTMEGTTHGQGTTNRALYQIVSGTFEINSCGFFPPPPPESMPDASYAFVSLSTDPQTHTAQLQFLDRNFRPSFSLAPSITNGVMFGNEFWFQYRIGPTGTVGEAMVVYEALTNADTLYVNGGVQTLNPVGGCVANALHRYVWAFLTPSVSIRLTGGPKVCWATEVNRTYQVYCASNVTTNTWMPWGEPVAGTGGTVCVRDGNPPDQQRFYRVALIP